MTSESATSPAIPPPPEHQPLPQNSVYPETVPAAPPSPPPPQITMEDIVNSNGILTDQLNEEDPSFYKYLESEEYAEKYRRYEDNFKQYIVDKYFSGDDMYEERTTIDGETIYSSKWPSLYSFSDSDDSFVDPVQCIIEDEEKVEGEGDEEEEEVEEVEAAAEEEVEEVEDVMEVEESVDSASAVMPNGEISNGGTVLEKKDNC
ncbi:proline-, glutamic acid- and leucine-rich protein 1 [Capsella rubella]|nr:proline-, glutamic acid- and leucine-rich protein 1 [Capsella rubella]